MQTTSGAEFKLLRWLFAQARSHRFHILGILLLELLATPLALLTPLPIQIGVDSILHGRPVPAYLRWALPPPGGDPRPLLLGVCLLSLGIVLLNQAQSLASGLLS